MYVLEVISYFIIEIGILYLKLKGKHLVVLYRAVGIYFSVKHTHVQTDILEF